MTERIGNLNLGVEGMMEAVGVPRKCSAEKLEDIPHFREER